MFLSESTEKEKPGDLHASLVTFFSLMSYLLAGMNGSRTHRRRLLAAAH